MPTFAYEVVTNAGKRSRGSIEAQSVALAAGQLKQRGLFALSILPAENGTNHSRPLLQRLKFSGRTDSGKQRLIFARTMASMLGSGVPVDRALGVSADLATSPALKSMYQRILRDIKGGKSVSSAMEAQSDFFPPFYFNMVRSGEASGKTAEVFNELATYQETINELKAQLISALVYPALLAVVGFSSVFLLLEFVVPRFATVFEDAGAALPLSTQILLALSTFVRATSAAWIVGVPLLVLAVSHYFKSEAGRNLWARVGEKVPLVRTVIQHVLVARLFRSLGVLIRGGVPIVRALEIGANVVGNNDLAEAVRRSAIAVKQGHQLTNAFAASKQIPPLALHMIGVGEESGHVDSMLLQVADVYERDARTAMKTAISLFEPIMILGMGVLVGWIVISIMLAVFSINDIPL